MDGRPLVILTGPTAVGKTALSIALAKRLSGEIISADSMQVYRGMDIGSAKITKVEMDGVPHHLIDILPPQERFDVYRFRQLAKEAVSGIYGRGHLPVVVGGTGFYIQALLYDIDFTEEDSDPAYRKELETLAQIDGKALYRKLLAVDPQAAEDIHPHNHKRLIRALEYFHLTGERISGHNRRMRRKQSPYRFCYFVLTDERGRIYEAIEKRVDQMLQAGLVEEVEALRAQGVTRETTAMQGLGYKEIYDYLDGQYPLEEAVRLIKRDTRHFAKRQLTWFRREREVIWVDKGAFDYDEERILSFLQEKTAERTGRTDRPEE